MTSVLSGTVFSGKTFVQHKKHFLGVILSVSPKQLPFFHLDKKLWLMVCFHYNIMIKHLFQMHLLGFNAYAAQCKSHMC